MQTDKTPSRRQAGKSRPTTQQLREFAAKQVLTSGQISKLCSVAPRTVNAWIDQGLLAGYRLPNSKDRRVHRSDLVTFLRARQMAAVLREYFDPPAYVYTLGYSHARQLQDALPGMHVTPCRTAYALATAIAEGAPFAVLLDLSLGSAAADEVAAEITTANPGTVVIGLVGDDVAPDPRPGYSAVLQSPTVDQIATLLTNELGTGALRAPQDRPARRVPARAHASAKGERS